MHALLLSAINLFLTLRIAAPLPTSISPSGSQAVSPSLFQELEELSRIVDISYCVGSTGIHKPFGCLSRCSDFVGFELVTTWNTGPLLSDSCGYIALSHPPSDKRIILAFRGTYSIANTVVDLSTNPAEYVPFPGDQNSTSVCTSSERYPQSFSTFVSIFQNQNTLPKRGDEHNEPECQNCTIHSGFLTSWTNTRCLLIPHLEKLVAAYPDYKVTLVGHSLGGAVAAIAALEFEARGWKPHVTTFGEPRVGNKALNKYIDERFSIDTDRLVEGRYRRVTHVDDPIPLLPLEEWGYRMHAGEIYISKKDLSPDISDLEHCVGDEDPSCIARGTSASDAVQQSSSLRDTLINQTALKEYLSLEDPSSDWVSEKGLWPISPRYRLWELFFAHRDYFWRLGLCVPGGDPKDWWRKYPDSEEEGPRSDL